METLPSPGLVDLVAMALVAVGAGIGYHRRLSGELASAVSAVAAFVLGLYLCRPFGEWLRDNTRLGDDSARLAAFTLAVICVIAAMIGLRLLLRNAMRVVFEPALDRIGGCIAGFLKAATLTLIFFFVMIMCPSDYLNRKFGEESFIGTLVIRNVDLFRDTMEQSKEEIRAVKDRVTGTERHRENEADAE